MYTLKSEMFKALESQDEVEISSEIYWEMMEILPPLDFGTSYFVFQEGDGDRIMFRKVGVNQCTYYACLERAHKCTEDFKIHVRFSRTFNRAMMVSAVFSDDKSLEQKYAAFVGREGDSIASLAGEMGLSFR